jgi:hypothetical protein
MGVLHPKLLLNVEDEVRVTTSHLHPNISNNYLLQPNKLIFPMNLAVLKGAFLTFESVESR